MTQGLRRADPAWPWSEGATRDADPVAIVHEGRALRRAPLLDSADALARRLAALGLRPGDRVATFLGAEPAFVRLFYATARLGLVLVPLSPRLSRPELAERIARVEPRLVLTRDPHAVPLPPGAEAGDPAEADPPILRPSQLALVTPREVALRDAPALDEPLAIVFTSGTSGTPKGVALRWRCAIASAEAAQARLGFGPRDRWLVTMPLQHVGGLAILVRTMLFGGRLLLQPRFDPAAVSRALDHGGAGYVSLVPTMLARLLEARDGRPAPEWLRALILGGGPASPDLLARAHALGYPLAPTYGLTETSSMVATAPPGWDPASGPMRAPPLPGVRLSIVGPDDEPLPAGAVGEIQVAGPMAENDYWRDPAATAAARGPHGWCTGDFGRLDARGWLEVLARRDDLVVSGGENVSPAEVEAVLDRHPDVLASAVVGLPDETWGQVVAAAVELRPGAALDLEALQAFARASLAGYKLPRRVRWLPPGALPRTATGKLRRGAVREAWPEG